MATKSDPPMRTNELVAENIRVVMFEKRTNQSKIAPLAGHSIPWLSQRLTGRYAFRTSDIDEVADALGVPSERLFRPLDTSGQ